MKIDFIIVGGGIAGLTTAIALQNNGHRVKVLEQTNEIKEVGAGLGLGANAWKGLIQLGITDELEMKCNVIDSTKFLDEKGNLISEMDIGGLMKNMGSLILPSIVQNCKNPLFNTFNLAHLN